MARLSVHPLHRSGVSGSEDLVALELGVAVIVLALFFPEGFLDLGGITGLNSVGRLVHVAYCAYNEIVTARLRVILHHENGSKVEVEWK